MKTRTKTTTIGKRIKLQGRQVKYTLVQSNGAQKLRVRIGPNGVEVLRPRNRSSEDVKEFLLSNQRWIVDQLRRVDNLKAVRRPVRTPEEFLFQGKPTPVVVIKPRRGGANAVGLTDGCLTIVRGNTSQTHPAKSLEYWLRRRARQEINDQLNLITRRLKVSTRKVFVMEQRTKWGNCSAKGNLSFNWRLILAPEFVLRYIVAHEATHLKVADHSARFWLTVQSLCPDATEARKWLRANGDSLMRPLNEMC